jgi:type II secretory pathway pseudopilin PulG
MRTRTPRRDDRGDTLLELIIAVSIMGVALVAILGGVATAIVMSDTHRKQAQAGAAVRGYAEAIETMVAGAGLATCANLDDYDTPAGFTVPGGFAASVVETRFWAGGDWDAVCTDTADLQRLTVQVRSDDGSTAESRRVTETVTVVLRRP